MMDDAYFDQFTTPKYRQKSRLKRLLLRRFVARLHELFVSAEPFERVLEVGAGQGFLSGFLAERYPDKSFTGVDRNDADLGELRRRFPQIETRLGDIYRLSELEGHWELVICAEVLEHLDDPGRGLENIVALRPRRVLLTVPHEPWFMLSNLLRGKNIMRFGDDVEHVQHFTVQSFRRLLESRLELEKLTTSYPWILALGKPRA